MILRWLILAYRRFLSGRLPGVRCSFADDESCSAYGLRATEGPGALGKIRRRLARCRDACLLTDGHALSWSALHERDPAEIEAELRADGEGEAAIARVLETRRAVAIWRREQAGRIGHVRLVSQPAVQSRWQRRAFVLAAIAVVCILVAGAHPVIGGLAFGTIATGAVASTRDAYERDRRFALHARWARRR